MNPNYPARLTSCRSCFPPETGRISSEFFGQIANAQDLFATKVCKWHFRCRGKEKLILFQAVHVSFKLRKLRCADHAIASHQEWWTNLEVAMLARMQVDHEIDQSALQLRANACETNKTASAELCRPLRIEKIESWAKRNVIDRVGKWRFLLPAADDAICARIFANWNALMRQVCNLKKQIVLLGLGRSRPRIEISDLIADVPDASLQLIGPLASREFFADLLAQPIAIGIQLLQRRLQFAASRVRTQDAIDLRFIVPGARGQPRAHKIGLLANQTNVEHGAIVEVAIADGKSDWVAHASGVLVSASR